MKRNFLLTSLIAFALVFVVGCAAEKPTTQKVSQIDEKVLPEPLKTFDLKPALNRGRLEINEETLAKMGADGVPGNVLEALRNMEGKKSFNTVEAFTQAVNAASPEAEKFMDRILGNALVTELEDEPDPPQTDMMLAKAEEKAVAPSPTVEPRVVAEDSIPPLPEIGETPPPPPSAPSPPPIPPAPPWPKKVAAMAAEPPPMPISFDTVLFDFDKFEILSEYKSVIQDNATKLLDNPSMVATIEGHADERGTNEYNLALGQRRAEAIREALIESGVPPSQLQTITFGEERPAELGRNEEAWRLNRRGEMVDSP